LLGGVSSKRRIFFANGWNLAESVSGGRKKWGVREDFLSWVMGHGSWVEEGLNRQDAKGAMELKAGMLEGAFSVFWSWISTVLGERFCADRAREFANGGKTCGLFVEGPGAS